MVKLGQNLLKFWPVSLEVKGAPSHSVLQAHGGRCMHPQYLQACVNDSVAAAFSPPLRAWALMATLDLPYSKTSVHC